VNGSSPKRRRWETLRLSVAFQWFLTALSVLPGSILAMAAHLFPNRSCACKIIASSRVVNGRCSTVGLSWLHHRSLHDFPDRPFTCRLIKAQFFGPWASTSPVRTLSSSALHVPLTLTPLLLF
ncbi:hypothetical protein V8G54_036877, partial [Vigna mungo]